MYLNYLNNHAKNELKNNQQFLTENIFSIKAWSKEHKNEVKKANNEIKIDYEKKLNKTKETFKKNYKEDYEFIKFHNIPFIKIIDNYKDFKSLIEKIQIDTEFSKINPRTIYDYLASSGPCTIVFDIDDKKSSKHFKGKKEKFLIPFIFIPERTFFKKIFGKGDLLGFFQKAEWIELEKQLSIFHEVVEVEEFSQKRFLLGKFYVKQQSDFYSFGNHYSIFVLAKEAVVLNKFKHLEAIKVLRDWRLKYEWRIIKAKTGIDFSKLEKLTPEIAKKIMKIKPDIIGDTQGLFLKASDLKYYKLDKKSSKFNSNKSIPKMLDKLIKQSKIIKII